jgi:hypothetical protein
VVGPVAAQSQKREFVKSQIKQNKEKNKNKIK